MSQVYVRNVDAGEYFESFIVAAVASIVAIRVFLHLTGYPQVGGETLHIAHMLWGGLGMLVALVLTLGFLGSAARSAAAVIGGIGFGTFIDELGKFITADNDYFYQPTFALIYVIFVLLFLVLRHIQQRALTPVEHIANALELLHEAVRHDLDEDEHRRAVALLEPLRGRDPIADKLHRAFAAIAEVRPVRPGLLARLRHGVRAAYRALAARPWFARAVVIAAIGFASISLVAFVRTAPRLSEALLLGATAYVLAAMAIRARQRGLIRRARAAAAGGGVLLLVAGLVVARRLALPDLPLMAWGELVATVVPASLVLVGVWRLPRSRLSAYRTFRSAVLFQLLVTQFFAFYTEQLRALVGLAIDLTIFITLRAMIVQEEGLGLDPGTADGRTGAA